MNITKDIIGILHSIDLSTEDAVVDRYESLANSPILVILLKDSVFAESRAAYQASGGNPEVISGVLKDKLKEYATIGRTICKRRTIKAIRRHIGVLFAEWEAEEKTDGIPAKDSYLYSYAIENGLDPDGESLSKSDTEALDKVAEYIFTTIEAYLIYSLKGVETASESLLSHKVYESSEEEIKAVKREINKQMDILFAPAWENVPMDELTTSCEEECNFFSVEACFYTIEFLKALDYDVAAILRTIRLDKEDMEQAKKTKYKNYINANTPC